MKYIIYALVLLLAAPALAGEGVGTLTEKTGVVRVTHVAADTPIQDLKVGDPVFADDIVETQDSARAVFKFADEAELVITGKGKLVVDEYIYNAEKKTGKAAFDISGMAFSWLGGLMEKGKDPAVTLNIDYGSIGIRGTKLMGVMRNGFNWVYLEEGAATVANPKGETALDPGFGARIVAKDEAPSAAYQWSDAEIAWLKNLVNDPAAHETLSVALNTPAEAPERQRGGMEAKGAADEMAPPSGGGAPAASAPAAPAAEMNRAAPALSGAAADEADADPARANKETQSTAKAKRLVDADYNRYIVDPATVKAGNTLPDGTVLVSAAKSGVIQLAKVDMKDWHFETGTLTFSADLNTQQLKGKAWLEIWVFYPGAKGMFRLADNKDAPPGEDRLWKPSMVEMKIQPGDKPAYALLNLVVTGQGGILLRNISLQR